MSLKNNSLRSNQTLVTCDNARIQTKITSWINCLGWKFENFADFMALIGLKTPINLSELNESKNSFKCLTSLGTEVIVFLNYYCIYVVDGEERRKYSIKINSKKEENIVPKVTLQERIIEKNGKVLSNYYDTNYCHRILSLDNIHTIDILFYESDIEDKPTEKFVLKNCQEIEEYILQLDTSLVLSEVYDKIMHIMGFSKKDLNNNKKISISFSKKIEKEENTYNKTLFANGSMSEYAVLKDGETFQVFKDGSWRYFSDKIKIFYYAVKDSCDFSITSTEEDVTNLKPGEIMNHVKKKISKLWKFVR